MSEPQEISRPRSLPTVIYSHLVGHHKVYVRICYHPDTKEPFEVWMDVEHNDACEAAYLEALTRSINLGLRCGIPAEKFISQLQGIKCVPEPSPEHKRYIYSPADYLALSLKKFIQESNGTSTSNTDNGSQK